MEEGGSLNWQGAFVERMFLPAVNGLLAALLNREDMGAGGGKGVGVVGIVLYLGLVRIDA